MTQREIKKILLDLSHPRTPGSSEEKDCALYIESLCRQKGLCNTKIETFPLPDYKEKAAKLLIDGVEVPCRGKPGSVSGRAEAPLYYLSGQSKTALSQCKGKVVLTEQKITAKLYKELLSHGAEGIIAVSGSLCDRDKAPDFYPIRFALEGDKHIPFVTIHISSALRILRQRAKQAKIVTEMVKGEGISHNLLLELPGELSEAVVLSAHYDSTALSCGAFDNLSGIIALLYIAEYLSKKSLRRTVRFLFCGGEEWGLLGSYAYCQAHREEASQIKMNINLDMLGTDMGEFVAFSSADEATANILAAFGARHRFPLSVRHAIRSSDSNSFVHIGVPAISFARYSPAEAVRCHTPEDTAEIVSPLQLKKDAHLIARFVEFALSNDSLCQNIAISDFIREEVEKYFGGRK